VDQTELLRLLEVLRVPAGIVITIDAAGRMNLVAAVTSEASDMTEVKIKGFCKLYSDHVDADPNAKQIQRIERYWEPIKPADNGGG
jgi:hypothetical protein